MGTGKESRSNYKRVEYLINKAEIILENIEKIKEEQRKELQE